MTGGQILISLLPVVLFLAGLVSLDSFKLVRPALLTVAIVSGAAAAVAALGLNTLAAGVAGISTQAVSGFVAPVVEETLKGAIIIALIMRNRIGFSVDAAIAGFAVGTGFALLENTWYWTLLSDAPNDTWLLRGFGSAIMHATATSVFAVTARTMLRSHGWPAAGFAALAVAIGLHVAYNLFLLPPVYTVIAVLVVAPLVLLLVFRVGEYRTRVWLGTGFDTDQELLRHIMDGTLADSHVGLYLDDLRSHVSGPVLADMVCLMRLRVELSLRAKGMLMMRSQGYPARPDAWVTDRLAEMRYLETAIGTAGLLAMEPLYSWSRKDLSQLGSAST